LGSLPYASLGEPYCDQWENRSEKIQSQNCKYTSGSVLEVTAPLENQISNIKTEDGYGYHETDNQE